MNLKNIISCQINQYLQDLSSSKYQIYRFKFNAKAAKKYEEKRINQYRLVQAKGLKKGFKNNILKNNFKDNSL